MKPRVRIPWKLQFVARSPADEAPECVRPAAHSGATNPVAKATKGKAGTAGVNGPVRRSTAGTGLRVGEAIAVWPATSEIMDATAGETAPNSSFTVTSRGEAAAIAVSLQSQTVAAETFPDIPEFLRRDADGIAPYAGGF